MYSFGTDYFSRTCGFVIDGNIFLSRDDAAKYLVEDGCMAPQEAETYLVRLANAFTKRRGVAVHG